MKNTNECKIEFEDLQEKIREMFSTPYILHCYSDDRRAVYIEFFKEKTISSILENKEILTTTKLFLENNLTLSKAAKQGFLHRNTLIYRINKLKRITGLNIRKFNDAVIFANMLEVYKDLF